MTDESASTSLSRPKPTPPATGNRGRFVDAVKDSGLRRFTTGTLIWGTAHQMITLTQGVVLIEILEADRIWLAFLGGAVGGVNVLTALFGGILADRVPRKFLLMLGSTVIAIPMLAVAVLHAVDALEPWHLLVAGGAQGFSLALDWVSRLSLLPTMVSRRIMVSALSIDQASFNAARVIGPLLAAGMIAWTGATSSYAIITGLFAVAILIYTTFRRPVENGAAEKKQKMGFGTVVHELKEAGQALRSDTVLSINVLFTAVNAMMLGGFVFMVAAFVNEFFGTGEFGNGLIFGATGTGAFIGAMIVAYRGGTSSAGTGLIVSNLLFAGFAVLYAVSGNTWIAASVAFFFGLFNAYHIALGIAAIQTNVPDHVRGRVTGVYELAWASFPLGGLIVGSMAELVGLRGALALAAGAVAAITLGVYAFSPRLRALSLRPSEGE